ncbi:hypothetical protein ACLSZP_10755 [Avibacterium avium]|uniref:hypothetical protein n=1 Tax=Avibacterium avium TaxID=751 RepID=UPI003BF84793
MASKNIELIKRLLIQSGAKIHPMTEGVMVCAYQDKGENRESFVCSWLGSDLTVSISINGKANLKKSTKLVKSIFGKYFAIEHLKNCPLDGQQANYFGLQFLN